MPERATSVAPRLSREVPVIGWRSVCPPVVIRSHLLSFGLALTCLYRCLRLRDSIHLDRVTCSTPLGEALSEAPGLEAVLVKEPDGLVGIDAVRTPAVGHDL